MGSEMDMEGTEDMREREYEKSVDWWLVGTRMRNFWNQRTADSELNGVEKKWKQNGKI